MNKYTYEVITTPQGDTVIERSDGTWIPKDPANSDYAEYLASLEATEPEAE
jgi:hypothetical protein